MAVGYWLEVWKRPGHPTFGRLIDDPPFETATFHIGVGLVGDGSMSIPDNYDRLHDLLRISGGTSQSSLVRIREDETGTIVGEWLPRDINPPADKSTNKVDVTGNGIAEILTYGVTQPFDWDGSADFACQDCDWTWGDQTNLLTDGGFEAEAFPNGGFEQGNTNYWTISTVGSIVAVEDPIQAFSGNFYGLFNPAGVGSILRRQIDSVVVGQTYTFTVRIDDLSGTGERVRVGVNGALIATHTNAYEADGLWYAEIANAPAGTGTTTAAYQLTTVTFEAAEAPVEVFIEYLGVNDHNLAVDDAAVAGSQFGAGEWVIQPSSPTMTMNIGEISTDQAHSGVSSLKLQGDQVAWVDAFGRISYVHVRATQFDIPLTVGKLYTSYAWFYNDSGAPSNFSIWAQRAAPKGPLAPTIDGGFLPAPGSYHMAARTQTVPPTTWTKLSWTTIADTTLVSMAAAWNGGSVNVGLQSSPTFYVDDYVIHEGLPATTVGAILTRLYQSYINPLTRTPIVWDDGAGNPYLTLDFTGVLTSAGTPWANPEVSIQIWQRMSFLEAVQALETQEGIESRVVVDNPETGTWKLQVYNEGEMDNTPNVVILGGAEDTRRQIRESRPPSWYMVEGQGRVTSRRAAAALMTGLGRIETAILSREATGLDGTSAQADYQAAVAEDAGKVWSYELTNPVEAPLVQFGPGDTIGVHDPPTADGTGRVWEVNLVLSKTSSVSDIDILVTP